MFVLFCFVFGHLVERRAYFFDLETIGIPECHRSFRSNLILMKNKSSFFFGWFFCNLSKKMFVWNLSQWRLSSALFLSCYEHFQNYIQFHGFILRQRDNYFKVNFDHIWSELHILDSWGSSKNWLGLKIELP
jgi:hypothetical protein